MSPTERLTDEGGSVAFLSGVYRVLVHVVVGGAGSSCTLASTSFFSFFQLFSQVQLNLCRWHP